MLKQAPGPGFNTQHLYQKKKVYANKGLCQPEMRAWGLEALSQVVDNPINQARVMKLQEKLWTPELGGETRVRHGDDRS